MHIALITAGGAGMFCGSCMHDNTWTRALLQRGVEVSLIPTYTPLRVDEPDQSLQQVFLGGLNVYLSAKLKWWRFLPRPLTAWLDRPGVIRWATQWSVSNDAAELGDLAISMLRGEHGPHRDAVQQLARFIARDLRPDVIIFSNALLAGALAEVQQHWPVPTLCTLQGDDVFLDGLPETYRSPVTRLVSQRAQRFHKFLVHSEFYRNYISRYLDLPTDQFLTLPLGIDFTAHTGRPLVAKNPRYTIGYFARVCPEKGFHHLVDALVLLRERVPDFRLRFGGYQQSAQQRYLDAQLAKLSAAGIDFENIGSPETAQDKAAFLQSLDVLSVPTDFLEPKGMYVLEALANGVPVVQPAHGAFPEIIQATGGGIVVVPRSAAALADGLDQMSDPEIRLRHAQQGWQGVRDFYGAERMVDRTLEILHELTLQQPLDSRIPEPAAVSCAT